MSLVRFGVSIPAGLIKKFDRLIQLKNYPNRSEAIRDLIRKELVEEEVMSDKEGVGILHLLYNHHRRELSEKLTDIQHHHHHLIQSSLHIHLDDENCLEVIVIRGKSSEVKSLADSLIATKGVKHGKLNITSTGKYLV